MRFFVDRAPDFSTGNGRCNNCARVQLSNSPVSVDYYIWGW